MGDLGRAEGGGPEEVGGGRYPHAHEVTARADLVGLVELALELADRHPGQLGQLGDVQGGGEVVFDELRRGFDLQERLEEGLRAFVTADGPADPAGPPGFVEDGNLGGLIPDVVSEQRRWWRQVG